MLVIGADGKHTIITNTSPLIPDPWFRCDNFPSDDPSRTFRRTPGVQQVPVPVIWIATRSHFPQPPGFLCCNNIQQYQQSSS
jgi:hypothetical protein